MNNINNFLEIESINYLINLKISNSPIYLSRHGQSIDNILGIMGGDSSLSDLGKSYIDTIDKYFDKEGIENLKIFTSVLNRTIETSRKISKKYTTKNLKILNEINAGICEGLTYEQIKQSYPVIYTSRKKDKFNYRYPEEKIKTHLKNCFG
jgi:broad specificity phosphatase PhoE